MDVRDKGVLVTGGSRGLGAALGRELARVGAKVALVARGREVEATAAAIRRDGGEAYGLVFDVADKEATYRIAGAAAALVGDIELLVHNASALGPTPLRLLLDTSCEDLTAVLETNLVGPFRLTKAIAGGMALRGHGTVVHVSSDAATNAYPHWGAYGVSKAALDHLSRTWAAELAETGVRFVSVDPGEMRTQMHADALPDADPATLRAPADVAAELVRLLQSDDPPALANGGRYELASFGGAR